MSIEIKSPFLSDMPENERAKALEQLLNSPAEKAKQEAKASQEAVAMFAEYQKKQLLEQRLIAVATPLLAAMITNQGIAKAASWIAEADVELSTQEQMLDASVEIASQLVDKISKTVNSTIETP